MSCSKEAYDVAKTSVLWRKNKSLVCTTGRGDSEPPGEEREKKRWEQALGGVTAALRSLNRELKDFTGEIPGASAPPALKDLRCQSLVALLLPVKASSCPRFRCQIRGWRATLAQESSLPRRRLFVSPGECPSVCTGRPFRREGKPQTWL